MRKQFSILPVLLLFTAQAASAATYKVDPVHSEIGFTVDHLVVFKVSGTFDTYQGTIETDPKDNRLTAAGAVLQVASVDTREQKRDDHLRSSDFFDAATHPEMTFVSKRVLKEGNSLTVYGDLTIRGITREVALKGGFRGEQIDPWGNVRAGFYGSTVINRHDFGLNWNKALDSGGYVVGDDVTIRLEIQGIREA